VLESLKDGTDRLARNVYKNECKSCNIPPPKEDEEEEEEGFIYTAKKDGNHVQPKSNLILG
jgi:hypothetical protein